MTYEAFESVWDVIEDTPAEAENMKLRFALMIALKEHIAAAGLSQPDARSCSESPSHGYLTLFAGRSGSGARHRLRKPRSLRPSATAVSAVGHESQRRRRRELHSPRCNSVAWSDELPHVHLTN